MNRDRVQKRDPVHRTGPPPGSDPSRPRDSKPGSSTHTQHSSVRRRRYRSRSQRTHKPTHGSSTAAMDGYARAEDESFPPRLVSLTWEDPLEQCRRPCIKAPESTSPRLLELFPGSGFCRGPNRGPGACQRFNERLVSAPEHIAQIWMANYLIKNFVKVQPLTCR
ncbi:unnamed protein product [Gadus morhua 'NCC']